MGRGWEMVVGGVVLLLAGCSHSPFARGAADAAKTVMETECRIELDNLAMFADNPAALPWHVRLTTGTVQVKDETGVRELSVETGASPAFGGPHAIRAASEQWEVEAVTDARTVKRLQDVYRAAMGLGPLPDAAFLGGGSGPGEVGVRQVVLSRDVPVGWFRTGEEKDVPEGALYVGHHRGRFAWVMRDGQEAFARFTLVVLTVVWPTAVSGGAGGK